MDFFESGNSQSADQSSNRDDLHNKNERLKFEILQLLQLIDDDAKRNAISSGGIRQKTTALLGRDEMKRELEIVNERVAKLRSEIDRDHQISSLRSIEDHMRATKKELSLVKGEIQVLVQEGARQRRVLESNNSHKLIKSLELEIANERAVHAQLRKEFLAIQSHKKPTSSTVL